jgi:YD repeat-containing protein
MRNVASLINYLAKVIVMIIAILVIASEVKAQQGGAVSYGYDANGRLISVTLPTGESVKYNYDPAGNITAIERLSGPGPQIFSFSPLFGFVDDTVSFNGNNFGTVSTVVFNGTNATVFSGNLTQITAKVPSAATTGQITVTLSNGTFTTASFSVLAIQVTPVAISVLPNQSQQFRANVPSQLSNTAVTWSVNGVNGGNSNVGTISSNGLYIAPNITTTQTFNVRATSVARPTAFAQATVKVSADLYQSRTAIVVGYRSEVLGGEPVASVSILKGQISSNSQTVPIYSPPVSVTIAPSISNITPSNLARNTSNNITISGANLTGTTTLVFLNDASGQINSAITVSNLTVAGDGNSLTATINVGSSSTTGNHRVVISGAISGHSITNNVTSNIISITP